MVIFRNWDAPWPFLWSVLLLLPGCPQAEFEIYGDLSPEQAELVWETLEQIEAPLAGTEELERRAVSFEELVEKVAEACTGEVMLWQRLWYFTEELITDERISPDIQALGAVLRKILAGERQKYLLDDLASEHRWAVEQLLDWLNEQAVEPNQGSSS